MFQKKTISQKITKCIPAFLILGLMAGCASTQVQSQKMGDDYVEIENPAFTTSPTAPPRIWVPRKNVESGIPRGSEVVKMGYDALTGGSAAAQPTATGASAVTPAAIAAAPQGMTSAPTTTAPQAGITAPGGKPAAFIPRFGLVVAVDGDKVYFNLGRDSGIAPSQKLKIYRGGTVVEGLGLAPGQQVAIIEVQGFVGSGGSYGLVKNGAQIRVNDLVGAE